MGAQGQATAAYLCMHACMQAMMAACTPVNNSLPAWTTHKRHLPVVVDPAHCLLSLSGCNETRALQTCAGTTAWALQRRRWA
jgi:hypothetical protein